VGDVRFCRWEAFSGARDMSFKLIWVAIASNHRRITNHQALITNHLSRLPSIAMAGHVALYHLAIALFCDLLWIGPSLLNRRDALKVGLGTAVGSLVGSLPAGAEGQATTQQAPQSGGNLVARTDPTPLVDAWFPSEIAEHVWIIPDRRIFLVPNIGIIVGKKAALVIDCGLGPECGRRGKSGLTLI
jgi:hypothetical protein